MKRTRTLLLCYGTAALIGAATDSPATFRLVPSQYATIQLAIDAAVAGDTVLVSHGRYFENIRFRGKAIVVASRYLIDGDSSHIERTIIDGSRPANPDSGSTVLFDLGGDTTSVLCGFTITGGTGTILRTLPMPIVRTGGGILTLSSGARICHNRVEYNSVTFDTLALGAGINAGIPWETGTWVIIEDNDIRHNVSTGTLGAGEGGVGCCTNARILRNRIMNNETHCPTMANCGGVECVTFVGGVQMLVSGNIISGNKTYGAGVDGNGDSGLGGGLTIGGLGEGFRAIVEHNTITDNEVHGPGVLYGGGVLFNRRNDQTEFRNNWISGNKCVGGGENRGGGVAIWQCSPTLTNNIIAGNTGKQGGGIWIGNAFVPPRPRLMNNTICGNVATWGSGIYTLGAHPVVVNSILWNEGMNVFQSGGLVSIQYSDVRGGWPDTGNIDADPGFLQDTTYRLSATSPCIGAGTDSARINGIWYRAPSLCFYGGPRPDPAGSRSDIGACENPRETPLTGSEDVDLCVPADFALLQNYPNPFNPSTTIRYGLPSRSHVTLTVFNTLGQQVARVVGGEMEAGYHEAVFDASGLASGVYLYRLTAGSFVETRKLVLVR